MSHTDFTKRPKESSIQKVIKGASKTDDADIVYAKVLAIVNTIRVNHMNKANLFIKVELINAVFNTGILASRKYADYIFTNVENIDERLAKGDKSLINEIAKFEIENEKKGGLDIRNNYSFATKFCHLHQPELFPIYDSRVQKSLLSYQKHFKGVIYPKTFNSKSLRDYDTFCEVIKGFKKFSGIQHLLNRTADRFLWLVGE